MHHPPPVHFTSEEHEIVWDIICSSPRATEAMTLLWSELQRAAVIDPGDAPDDLVRMGSSVEYRDVATNERKSARLVFEDAGDRDEIAITTPLGAALIGLREGATFVWSDAAQTTRAVRIERVRPPQPHPTGPDRRRRRAPEQPGTGSASQAPVTVTIRRERPSARAGRNWELTFEPASPPSLDPLMGWTETNDPLAGHKVAFRTARDAIRFASRKGWDYRLVGGALEGEGASPDDSRGNNDGERRVDAELEQTFPASDAPSWTLGRDRSGD
jgi:regulator of nucleoside diphosphate kinase